jgi:hypothetical protein
MNRLANRGEIGDPCGVPFSRATTVPLGILIGALEPPLDAQKNPALVGVVREDDAR